MFYQWVSQDNVFIVFTLSCFKTPLWKEGTNRRHPTQPTPA
jgi:hypothetical protein